MLIEDKEGMKYLIWSIDKKDIISLNKISCSNVICGKKSCEGCKFESNDIDLSEFKILNNR